MNKLARVAAIIVVTLSLRTVASAETRPRPVITSVADDRPLLIEFLGEDNHPNETLATDSRPPIDWDYVYAGGAAGIILLGTILTMILRRNRRHAIIWI
jgi:hypothetical protein